MKNIKNESLTRKNGNSPANKQASFLGDSTNYEINSVAYRLICVLLLVSILLFSFSSCVNNDEPDGDNNSETENGGNGETENGGNGESGNGNNSESDTGNKKAGISSYVTTVMKAKLKNPESFQLHSILVMYKFEYEDYTYYSVSIDYSAQNGFGGYNRDEDYDIKLKVDNETDKVYELSSTEYWDAVKNYKNSK